MKDPHRVDAFNCFFCWAASEGLDGGGHDQCNNDRAEFGEDKGRVPRYNHLLDVEVMVSFMKFKNAPGRIPKISNETGILRKSVSRKLTEMGLSEKYPAIIENTTEKSK